MITKKYREKTISRLLSENDQPLFSAFVCDDCARFQSATAKCPPESGARSCFCASCQHFNIGSTYKCIRGQWLKLWIVDDAAADRLLGGGE